MKKPKQETVLDRDMIFLPQMATRNNKDGTISYTLGAKLSRKVSIMKEKFEIDISDMQNQIAMVEQN